MVSIKLSVFVAFVAMSTLAAVEAGKCNMDKAEMGAKKKQFADCYEKITGEQLPEDKAEMAKIDKTVMKETFICVGQEDGTIEADGKTFNMAKAKEIIQNSNQSDEVKGEFIKGTEACANTYKENEDMEKFMKCSKMVFMEVCM